ncbi:MAG TPA: c-type cytochrome biogenesis protein CcsB [Candidatus Sumerlaeota bacterium]|nr:c-type cytochrome biogenesis protein CcsB [Candidatus Sumerlaeota bacterium]
MRPPFAGFMSFFRPFLCVLLLIAVGVEAAPVGAATPIPLGREWDAALKPLATLPVQDTGFVRSALTYAQTRLMAISDKNAFEHRPALAVILPMMVDSEQAHSVALIKVEHPELGRIFGGKAISLNTFHKMDLYEKMGNLYREEESRLRRGEGTSGGGHNKYLKPINQIEDRADTIDKLAEDFAIIPAKDSWLSPAQLLQKLREGGQAPDAVDMQILQAWDDLCNAIRTNNPEAGAKAAESLRLRVFDAVAARQVALPKLRLDAFYQQLQPFKVSAFFYVFAALCYGGAMLFRQMGPLWRRLQWVGFAFLALGLASGVLGIGCRWILAGRAPLANMYESFTFATAGMVLVALVFEAIQRNRLAGFSAAVLGFVFMIVAHKLPIFDSKINPLMPALDSIWLNYHVVTIMLSYSAFALSFVVALAYLVKDSFGGDATRLAPLKRLPSLGSLDIFNYKVIAVGFPLLTIGIVLGAVWANTAWGRPWGFDPKETWSLITWLVYAAYLHVRFLAGWKGRRAAIIALIGFACVLFTYVGVNFLLPGLHSYA